MTREGGNWTPMDMEEESYFNGSDEEEDGPIKIGPIASSSRKRESDSEDSERKKVRIIPDGDNGLPRSQSWPGALTENQKGKGKGLVDYGEEEEEEGGGFVREIVLEEKEEKEAVPLIGPIQPTLSTTILEKETKPPETEAIPNSPPPPLGILRRKAEQEEEESFGLLSAATKAKKLIAAKLGGPIKISLLRSSSWKEVTKEEESKS